MGSTLKWRRVVFMAGTASSLFFATYQCLTRAAAAPADAAAQLDAGFTKTVRPFMQEYCITCHAGEKPEADLNLATFSSTAAVVKDSRHAFLLLERLKTGEMPPKDAKEQPTAAARQQVVAWFQSLRDVEMKRNAGDPGVVLARRLSNAEFDYTIRDLTGVDLHPTREFPVDPANTAGFDNSGESLTMSPSLLKKYLQAAHDVANHLILKPDGLAFSPTLMLAETDRDQYCVSQIITFYHQQNISYADYFRAAWQYKNRAALGHPAATLASIAADAKVSAKYLATLWDALETKKETIGPLAKLQELWAALPAGDEKAAEAGIAGMKDYATKTRAKVEMRFLNVNVGGRGNGQGGGGQIPLLWKDIQYASHRLDFDRGQLQAAGEPPTPPLDVANEPNAAGEFGPGRTVPVINKPGDPDLAVPAGQRPAYEAAFAKFCSIFPDKFYMEERGRNYFDTTKDRGRMLSAGFHSSMGYFRDDYPLYALILDAVQQKQLDEYWLEMDYVAATTARMYLQTVSNRPAGAAATATAPSEAMIDVDATSEAAVKAAETRSLQGVNPAGQEVIKGYFKLINTNLRAVDAAQKTAIPSHIAAILDLAARAYRRPLTPDERDGLLAYYKTCREKDGLSHEDTIREMVVAVLMSPDLLFRLDIADGKPGIHPLTDYELASRLSYFLWSSTPDDQLLARAAAGDLHQPAVIAAQAQRMLKDPRSRALAVEFGGNWLEFRRFQEISSVDRDRFASFTPALRDAMFEEPVRFLVDVFQNDRPILDLLYAKDTFVDGVLAKHYGMPVTSRPGEWVHIADASPYERGGILPMAAFLTKNAPGLRTSPVKRGNWVVKNVLGERIPPPPPNVPELPHDEAKLDLPLRDMLARHREDPSCAACHARIDSYGLVFEGFGPIGERRQKDLGGRTVDAKATFPGGGPERDGVAGLRAYIHESRENDFVDNLCGKLLVYALGRSPILPDELLVREMHAKLAADNYKFESAIEALVTSRQFLNKRGNDDLAER